MRIKARPVIALIMLATATLSSKAASAAPAELSQCLQSWNKLQKPEMIKIETLMAQDKDNSGKKYSKAQLKLVRAHLKQNETLKFRCPTFTPPPGLNPKR